MCGRYVLNVSARGLSEAFNAEASGMPNRIEAYNAAPGSMMPIVIGLDESGTESGTGREPGELDDTAQRAGKGARGAQRREVRMHRWGLIPHWSRDASRAYSMINARSEGIDAKPSFRDPFRRQRCVVPANGFYEWVGKPSSRQPYYIHPASGTPFVLPAPSRAEGTRAEDGLPLLAFAGLYDHWRAPDGTMASTFTIITTAAGRDVERLHDRMPAMLLPDDVRLWLDPYVTDPARLGGLLHPAPERTLIADEVSRAVNDARNQGPALIEPVGLFRS
jgi:putative SOS response-associated peptidase YedK